ncbi:unnamed protein product [Sphagnum troendelagicum]
MAALSGLRERQKTTRRTSRCSLERSGATSHNNDAARSIAVLHVLLRRCSAASRGAASYDVAALQAATLCNVATLQTATLCNVATLRRCKLQRCGAAARVATTLRRYAWLQHCGAATRVAATLRRCSLYGYDVATLQLTWL